MLENDSSLINQLDSAQKRMVGLNLAMPRPTKIIAQSLAYWLKRTFPDLADNVSVETLSIRTLQTDVVPRSQPTPDGAVSLPPSTTTVPLINLLWRALGGQINAQSFSLDMANIVVVHSKNSVSETPEILNTPASNAEFKWLISRTAQAYEPMIMRDLDRFWDGSADFSHDRTVSDWLADEFKGQLRVQLDLLRLDATLSPSLHRALIEHALPTPDATSRAAIADSVRPGVYRLEHTPAGWSFSVPVRGAIALTRHDNPNAPGEAVLYRPGHPLQVFTELTTLTNSLKEDDQEDDQVNISPAAEHFLARLVIDLRTMQKKAVSNVLLNGPVANETISEWQNRLDAAADVGARLDLAGAMDERELKLSLDRKTTWLHANPDVTGADRLAWWRAGQALQTFMVDTPAPPDPITLGTPEALRDRTCAMLNDAIEKHDAAANPDQVILSIKRQIIDPHAPTGGSPFGSGVSMGRVKSTYWDRRALPEWAMANLTEDERNTSHYMIEGPLSHTQVLDVIETADVGARLPVELERTAREQQAQWVQFKEKQMRAQAWAAHISGDFRHDRSNTGLELVLAALDSPTAAGRNTVNDHEVVVRQLQWGDNVLKEIVAFGIKNLAGRPSLTLYTPGAPDGKTFRDVDAQNDRVLKTGLAQALTHNEPMTRWLISQLPLLEQADHLASLVPSEQGQTVVEKIKKITQALFSAARERSPNDFASTLSLPAVTGNLFKTLHETQISHAVKTADLLTVSNAERDNAAAREGRGKGVALLTGAMSIAPASRLGGVLARALLPTMVGGAAVSAINDEGGNFSQWASDFIGGLGEVVAEAGQDLIMARAARRRGIAPPPLSNLPRMPDPQLQPFLARGLDGKGLKPEGRNRYTDGSGQGYLKLGKDYYSTAMQGGERVIYAPDNRTHQRVVIWENGRWQVQEPLRLRGGGPLVSYFRPPQTPEQKKHMALIETVLARYSSPPPEIIDTANSTLRSMPSELTERLLRDSMAAFDVISIDTYRSRLDDFNQGRVRPSEFKQYRTKLEDMIYKFDLWRHVDAAAKNIEATALNLHLNAAQTIQVFDTAVPVLRKDYLDNKGLFSGIFVALPDNLTGARFVAIVTAKGKKRTVLDKTLKDIEHLATIGEAQIRKDLEALFPGEGPEIEANKKQYLDVPENHERLSQKARELLRDEITRQNKPGLLTVLRNNNIPYVIVNRGKAQKKTYLVTQQDIIDFEKNLTRYDIHDSQVETTPRPRKPDTPPAVEPSAAQPVSPSVADVYSVSLSSLAETQMAYDNFPAQALTKITEVIEDIRAGRVTTKRIQGYYWYDMAQLNPGRGRGAWRAAFERKGDTWVLQGFYDYHTTRAATVWGD